MSTGESQPAAGEQGAPSEEEMRAAYEDQIKRIRIEHVLLEEIVTLVNLGMRRTGLVEGTEAERDPDQVRLAIEAVRALIPLLEQAAPAQAGQIRDALSQLQLAYVRIGGQPAEPAAGAATPGPEPGAGPGAAERDVPAPGPTQPGDAGPAQRSGRLWVPGQ